MTDEERDALLLEAIKQNARTHYLLVALVQILVEEKVLKGKEEDVLKLLGQWGADLQKDDAVELRIEEHARVLREMWSKLPKQ